ncbi:MAG: hypothetical protein ACXVB9_00040 [Bdellovibrionota bacterium]
MKVITLLSFLALTLSPLAQAKNVFYPTHFSPKSHALTMLEIANGAGKLQYYGGPVIPNAKVTVVFWGNNVDAPTKNGVSDFYGALTKSDMMDWLDQYNTAGKSLDGRDGTNQHIGKGSFQGAVTINPTITSGKIDDKDIQAELQRQIDAGKLPKPDDSTLYMTYFPPGITITIEGMTSCSEFCAYHGFNGAPAPNAHFYYGVMPDLGGACSFGCGFGEHFNNVTSISTHEFCEAVTDPFPTPGSTPAYPQAWNDNAGSEIGDLCADSANTLTTAAGKTYNVQAEYDNSTAACSTHSWKAQ